MNIMNIITFLLLVLAAALVAGKLIRRRGKEVLFLTSSTLNNAEEGLFAAEGGMTGEQLDEVKERCAGDSPEEALSKIKEIVAHADPDADDQAVIYDEVNNLVVIGASVMARILGGDKELALQVDTFMRSFPTAGFMVADIRVCRTAADAQ